MKISCFVLCLLALGMPIAFAAAAQENTNQCMQDIECLLMVQQLEKAFRDNSIEIKNLEVLYTKLHLVYEKKKICRQESKERNEDEIMPSISLRVEQPGDGNTEQQKKDSFSLFLFP